MRAAVKLASHCATAHGRQTGHAMMARQSCPPFNPGPAGQREVFGFLLANKEYGIEVERVQELWAYEVNQPDGSQPQFFSEGIHLRGSWIPVIDLRVQLKLCAPDYNCFTFVIVLSQRGQIAAMVVDALSDIVQVNIEQLHLLMGLKRDDEEYVLGFARMPERKVHLLDIDSLITQAQLCHKQQASRQCWDMVLPS